MAETITNQQISYDLNSLPQIATSLMKEGRGFSIWLISGDLGAGKTTLIKEICLQLGASKDLLSSPTFSIIHEYPSRSGVIYHCDFYRMKNETEILDLGIEEYFDSGNLCLVEWPERLGTLVPSSFFKIVITHGTTDRIIEYEKHG